MATRADSDPGAGPEARPSEKTAFRRLVAHVAPVLGGKITGGVIVGALIALTGFGPEHWFAVAFEKVRLTQAVATVQSLGLDIRVLLVAAGILIIAVDVFGRGREQKLKPLLEDSLSAPSDKSGTLPLSADNVVEAPPLSLVVLPFQNLSDEPGQDYFVDGLVDDITTEMSRISGAFVIARNTAFTYKGKHVDVKAVVRELNVRYALEGSIRKAGHHLRLAAQLIDGRTGSAIWAERFDREVSELFALQDALSADLATTLNAKLIEAESRRSVHAPDPEATDLIMQGKAAMNLGFVAENLDRAIAYFDRAIQKDPNNVDAIVWYVLARLFLWDTYRFEPTEEFLRTAEPLVRHGLSIAPEHSRCKATLAMILRKKGAWKEASHQYAEAIRIDENYLWAYNGAALTQLALGNYDLAASFVDKTLKLSPRDPFKFWAYGTKGAIKFAQNDIAIAHGLFEQALSHNGTWPMGHIHLVAASALMANAAQAEREKAAYFTIGGPKTIEEIKRGVIIIFGGEPAYARTLYESLRFAGFAEN